jgi:hypothetical protein
MAIWIRPKYSRLDPNPPKYHVPSDEGRVLEKQTTYAMTVCLREVPSAGGYEIEKTPPESECCKRCLNFVKRWRR